MVFSSYSFILLFLPVCVAGFYLMKTIGGSGAARHLWELWLLALSVVFYALFGWKNLLVLGISLAFNLCFLLLMNRKKAAVKPLLVTGVLGNIALLSFFKYGGGVFFPIGISFYTFTQIDLLADMARGEVRDFSVLDYLTYSTYFPKILQGPITRYSEVTEAFHAVPDKRFDAEEFYRACVLFILALAKKALIADPVGAAVDCAYGAPLALSRPDLLIAVLLYPVQLYMDFSSCCEMGMAASQMMGIPLPVNFDSPYQTTSIPEYWRRWHMTLTRFFTNNIYIPLGGSRRGTARIYLNVMIIFLVSGLWHGTGWTFLIWGLLHGVFSVIVRAFRTARKRRGFVPGQESRAVHRLLIAGNYLVISALFILFRSATLQDAGTMVHQIIYGDAQFTAGFVKNFGWKELTYALKFTPWAYSPYRFDLCMWFVVVCSMLLIFVCPGTVRIARKIRIAPLPTILLGILLAWSICSLGGVKSYIYFRF